jgi:threonine dehydrogenase-like Zn-dependent dehydrogenase
MKAVVCQNAELSVQELPDPIPEKGNLLLKVLRCGICGSDLHVRHHCNHMGELLQRTQYMNFPNADEPMVFGHEFCGEILDHGPKTPKTHKVGTRVCAVPIIRRGKEIDMIGLSRLSHGAYAERMLVQESLVMPIPNGLSDDMAALTEPMAVGLHAVNRSDIGKRDVAIVIGCGPVGLAVICMLKAKGVKTVVASDYSPGRRALALKCGADVVIDPAKESPYEAASKKQTFVKTMPDLLELAISTKEKLNMLPVPWWHTWRLAETLGLDPKRPVIFECVGVPGLLKNIMDGAPLYSRVVVVGVCMELDKIEPAMGNNKEIDLRFVVGYTPLEFHDTLLMISEGKVPCEAMITGKVGLAGVDKAFTALGNPEEHAKILIDPSSSLDAPKKATASI